MDPVIGALAGATIGFLGSFGTTWLTQKKTDDRAKGDRQRQRLEDVYRTLIQIRRDFQETIGRVIQNVHYSVAVEGSPLAEIPPLIKLEMLINMYFPELKDAYKQFAEAKNAFGEFNAGLIGKDFGREPLQVKQKVCGDLLSHYGKVDKEITFLQEKVAVMTNA